MSPAISSGINTSAIRTAAADASLRQAGARSVIGADAISLDSPAADAPLGAVPPVLVFDGGCPFCRHFAELSELRGGIPGLEIRDGRADHRLRQSLHRRGLALHRGAIVIDGQRLLHGAEAIAWLCARMQPSDALLQLLSPLLAEGGRARRLYPALLLARRFALALRGLPLDPDAA